MRNVVLVILLSLLSGFSCLFSSSAYAACHAVTPSGSGSKTGTDWNNAYAGIPATLTRGDIYYLADGTYPSYTFSQSGSASVEIRKAQSYDNGSSCSPSIAAGWDAATMGSSQARFATVRMLHIQSPGLIINGNGTQTTSGCGGNVGSDPALSPAKPTDCGIKVDNSGCSSGSSGGCSDLITDDGVLSGGFTLKYVEILGNGNATAESYLIRADGSTGTLLYHIYAHHFGAVGIVAGGTTNLEESTNYWWRPQVVLGSNPNHGQIIEIGGSSSGGNIHGSVYRDGSGTGTWVFLSSGTSSNWKFYDNVIWNTVGYTPPYPLANGILDCINSHVCNGFTVMQNSIVGFPSGGRTGLDIETGGSFTVENNLWYNNALQPDFGATGTFTQDHNSFLNSGSSCPSGTANICNNSSADPFNNWISGDFTLASDAANWNNRLSLAAPYTTDASGHPFTTDRGAFQYTAGGNGPVSPTGLAAFVR